MLRIHTLNSLPVLRLHDSLRPGADAVNRENACVCPHRLAFQEATNLALQVGMFLHGSLPRKTPSHRVRPSLRQKRECLRV